VSQDPRDRPGKRPEEPEQPAGAPSADDDQDRRDQDLEESFPSSDPPSEGSPGI
jgi:hypothetical protein